MSFIKCKNCNRLYSDIFNECPFCNGQIDNARKEIEHTRVLEMRKNLILKINEDAQRFFKKYAGCFSEETINYAYLYIEKHINKKSEEELSDIPSIEKSFLNYLESITFDFFGNQSFFYSKLGVIRGIKSNYLSKIGSNTIIIFPETSKGCKGKMEERESLCDQDGDSYTYKVPVYAIENICCKKIVFPKGFFVYETGFHNVVVSEFDYNENASFENNKTGIIFKNFTLTKGKELPPSVFQIEKLSVEDLDGYDKEIRNKIGVAIFKRAFVKRHFDADMYVYDTFDDFFEDSYFIKDNIWQDNGVMRWADLDHENEDFIKYGYEKLHIHELECLQKRTNIVYSIPEDIESVCIPSEMLKHRMVKLQSGPKTKIVINPVYFYDEYFLEINYSDMPLYVPGYAQIIKFKDEVRREYFNKDGGSLTITCKDFDELASLEDTKNLPYPSKIYVAGKLLDKVIDFPNEKFNRNCFAFYDRKSNGVNQYFEKAIIYPSNFPEGVPYLGVKELTIKEGVEWIDTRPIESLGWRGTICQSLSLPNSLKNSLVEILSYFYGLLNVEIPSTSFVNGLEIKIDPPIRFFINDSISSASCSFYADFFNSCKGMEVQICFKDKIIVVVGDGENDKKITINNGTYQISEIKM